MPTSHSRARALRVLVIGGGIGGLCLAQGLRQAGFTDVAVYERDSSPDGRMQGYRLRISPDGEAALRQCLPRRAQELLSATANDRHQRGLVAYDERLNPMPAPTFDDPRGDSPDKIDAVDRATLRRVLLAGLADVVHFGKRLVRHEQTPDGVVAHFADGTSATGDVLVAADGANSAVGAQVRPGEKTRDMGVRAILSRTPRALAHEAGLPEVLRDRFLNVTGADGLRLALMPMVFRTAPGAAADRLWPDLDLGSPDDYYMSVFSVHQDVLGLSDERFFALSGEELRQLVLERTAGWHPDLRGIFAHSEPAETYPLALRATLPVEAWPTGTVIPLGDAVHLMPPTGGVGANTALRDASALCAALTSVADGDSSLADAVTRYQTEMVRYATEAVTMSLRIAQWSMKKINVSETEFSTT
ncbi:FAD-dependent oxidoreductase [Micromonospora sp. DT47]|uniref:FAD-dependent oxidoreductase n=1 Tax=Micromonospora sp. DT47 TaxID=3393431 RepID=UPI003CECE777